MAEMQIRVTPREKEVLDLLSAGKTADLIGEILGLTRHTVNTYKRDLMIRFGVANAAALVAKAIRSKIIE